MTSFLWVVNLYQRLYCCLVNGLFFDRQFPNHSKNVVDTIQPSFNLTNNPAEIHHMFVRTVWHYGFSVRLWVRFCTPTSWQLHRLTQPPNKMIWKVYQEEYTSSFLLPSSFQILAAPPPTDCPTTFKSRLGGQWWGGTAGILRVRYHRQVGPPFFKDFIANLWTLTSPSEETTHHCFSSSLYSIGYMILSHAFFNLWFTD